MEMLHKRQRELRQGSKKGFTLVELIVVVVILAILAAVAAPAMLGYVQKTRQDTLLTEAATIRTALQTVVTDAEAKGVPEDELLGSTSVDCIIMGGTLSTASGFTITHGVNQLIGANYATDSDYDSDGYIYGLELDHGTVTAFYFFKDYMVVEYDHGSFTVSPF
jgi:type IV pilus assembly protein PilA